MSLKDLPHDHPDRNRPLSGAHYRWVNGKIWKEIKPTFKIAGKTYNELGPAWTENDVFTFDDISASDNDEKRR